MTPKWAFFPNILSWIVWENTFLQFSSDFDVEKTIWLHLDEIQPFFQIFRQSRTKYIGIWAFFKQKQNHKYFEFLKFEELDYSSLLRSLLCSLP